MIRELGAANRVMESKAPAPVKDTAENREKGAFSKLFESVQLKNKDQQNKDESSATVIEEEHAPGTVSQEKHSADEIDGSVNRYSEPEENTETENRYSEPEENTETESEPLTEGIRLFTPATELNDNSLSTESNESVSGDSDTDPEVIEQSLSESVAAEDGPEILLSEEQSSASEATQQPVNGVVGGEMAPKDAEAAVFNDSESPGTHSTSSLSSGKDINLSSGSTNFQQTEIPLTENESISALPEADEPTQPVANTEGTIRNTATGEQVKNATAEQGRASQLVSNKKTIETGSPGTQFVKTESAKTVVNTEAPLSGGHLSQSAQNAAHSADGAFRIMADKAASQHIFKDNIKSGSAGKQGSDSERMQTEQRLSLGMDSADSIRPGRILNMSASGNATSFTEYTPQKTDNIQQELFEDVQISMEGTLEVPDAESQNQTPLRMGEFTIQNELVRRTILPSISQAVSTATSEGKQLSTQWQKHHVELENGKSLQLSTRQVDGVIQLKIATDNPELTKLLQQHLEDIKVKLEEEFNMSVEMELDGRSSGQEASAGFDGQFGDQSRGSRGASFLNGNARNDQTAHTQSVEHSVRRFGYNQMEWTA